MTARDILTGAARGAIFALAWFAASVAGALVTVQGIAVLIGARMDVVSLHVRRPTRPRKPKPEATP